MNQKKKSKFNPYGLVEYPFKQKNKMKIKSNENDGDFRGILIPGTNENTQSHKIFMFCW